MGEHSADERTSGSAVEESDEARAVRRHAFVREWADAITASSYVATAGGELDAFLLDLTERLIDILSATHYDPAAGCAIGRDLVAAHCTGSTTLSRSLALLSDGLLDLLRWSAAPEACRRLGRLVGDVGAGYATALRDLTLAEQDEISQAVFAAQRTAQQQLAFSEARFSTMFTEAAIGIGIGDMQGNILESNPALQAMFGYSAEAFTRRNVSEMVHPDDAPDVWRFYAQLLAGERDNFRVEKRFFRADGAVIWTNLSVSLIRDGHGQAVYQIAMLEDVTERHSLQARLEHMAFHDPLTGLANRAKFAQSLAEVFTPGDVGAADRRVGLCYLDLDGFKAVNDTLGHHVGDELLVGVAARLAGCCPPPHLVARMGGDEFVILLRDTASVAEVVAQADAVRTALTRPYWVGPHELVVTASIGVVELPVGATDPTNLMTAADMTLYRAKDDGKNRYAVYDRGRVQTEITKLTLAADLPVAIGRAELFLDYQPLVALSDGSWRGVEALVRWRHPTFGLIGPDRFIPVAEETGAIVPLGRWVLRQACTQAVSWWRTFGERAPLMSVNLAPSQLEDKAIIDDVVTVLDRTGLPAHRLQLELTENAIMREEPAVLQTLHTLAATGVRIVIDDFGTGYSNLSYLHRLPFHGLKLDASFVRGLHTPEMPDSPGAKIVAALIALAHALNLTVTAEGVERSGQLHRLRALHCDAGQGWLFGAGMSPERVTEHLARTAPRRR